MLNVNLTDNIKKIIQSVDASQAKITRATVRALNKTALWLKSQAAKEIGKEKQIKLTVMRKRLRIIKARTTTLEVIIKANLYDIRASSIGSMRQTRKGARAGKHEFIGAFIATMPTGHRGVFKREGRTALPIKEVKLPLEPEASKIIKELVSYEVETVFEKFFQRELNYIAKV